MNDLKSFAQRIRAAGFTLYSEKSYSDATINAELNLQDRTHYVDAGTRRFFSARILRARDECEGLIFGIIESTARDPDNRSRGFRPVFFDIDGRVLDSVPLDALLSTRAAADRLYRDKLAALDPIAVTRAALERVAKNARRQLADIETALGE
jgi:hypothetical protein